MAGEVPTWSRASQAQGGWRNRSHTNDGSGPDGIGVDLSGGWYDAGDHLKLHLPLGVTASVLAYGALAWETAYRDSGHWDVAVRNIDWVASYLLKCHYNASETPSENAFVAQVGDGHTDHDLYWGRPEQQPEGGAEGSVGWRPVYVVTSQQDRGADVVSEAVAAMTSAALVLLRPGTHSDPDKAQLLIASARQLFEFAKLLPNSWGGPPAGYQVMYGTSRWRDDLAWAAAWLCRADVDTGAAADAAASSACAEAVSIWGAAASSDEYFRDAISWAAVFPLATLLMRDVGAGGETMAWRYEQHINYVLNRWLPDSIPQCTASSPEYQVCYTPGGLAWYTEWGSARCAANVAMAALLVSRGNSSSASGTTQQQRRCWALRQMSYILGSNYKNQSFVAGYKPTPYHASPTRPIHKSSSCDSNHSVTCNWSALSAGGPNPNILYGALVGGPDRLDAYQDVRSDYVKNEVALDYNAGFTGALAGLADVTSTLLAASCSWDGYCAGSCSPRTDEGTPSLPPAMCAFDPTDTSGCALQAPPATPQPPSGSPPAPSPAAPLGAPPPSPAPLSPSFPPTPAPPSPSPFPPAPAPPSPSPPASAPRPPPLQPPPTSPPPAALCAATDLPCLACSTAGRILNASACRSCVAAMREPGFNPYSCHECANYGSMDAAVQDVCLTQCVPQAAPRGTSWACSMHCADVNNVGGDPELARRCAACVAGTHDGWACGNCIAMTRCLPDALQARQQCFDCVLDGVMDGKACGECALLGTTAARNNCMSCFHNQALAAADRRRSRL